MAKYPVNGNDDFKRAPPGTHVGVCNAIVDVGIQPGGMYGPKPKIYFRFELPNERVQYVKDGVEKDGPQVIGTFHTASMNKKALMRIMLENWRGAKFTDEQAAEFDVKNVLGKACLINVVEDTKDGKTYSNIANVMPLPKGTPMPQPENALLYFGPEDESKYNVLPEWLQKKIQGQIPPKDESSADDDAARQHESTHDYDQGGDGVPF